jgi:hypothetical protein
MQGRAFETGFSQTPCALRTAAIYGANAAGKSTIVKAIDFVQDLVLDSVKEESGAILSRAVPYRYDNTLELQPCGFEIAFIADGVLYTFGFSLNTNKITEEWLHFRTREGRTREAYSRTLVNDEYEWNFSSFFKSKKMTNVWKDACRPNALFISTAISLNCEELHAAYDWLTHSLRVLDGGSFGYTVTSRIALNDKDTRDGIVSLLRKADPSICNLLVKEKTLENSEAFSVFTEEFRRELIEANRDTKSYEISVVHRTMDGKEIEFDLEDESDGTRMMYRFAAPFLKSIDNDFVMIVDELDRSLHPLLLQNLVSMFTSPQDESCRGQLIFTTHDATLLSSDLLAPDQIWFADNTNGRGTQLIPLVDYKPRKGEATQRAYLRGRYGAIPAMPAKAISSAE